MWQRNGLSEYSIYFRDHGTTTFLVGIFIITVALYFLRYRNGRKLPPGPMGLPLFGYYLFLGKDPAKTLNEVAKKYGNVFSLYLGSQFIVILNDWESMKEATSQSTALDRPPSLFADVPYNFGVVGAYGQHWIQTRRQFSRTIKDIGLNSPEWEAHIQNEALDLAHRIVKEGDRPVEVREFFVESFANNVVTLILGERLHVGHPMTKLFSESVNALVEYTPTLGLMNFSPTLSKLLQLLGIEKEIRLAEYVKEFAKLVSDTVDERLRNPISGTEDSFIERFQEDIPEHKKEDSLKGNVIALLTGGGETTRTTIIWTLIAMANYPEKQRKVHEELDTVIGKDGTLKWKDRFKVPYTFAALLESMRWGTVVPFGTMRIASEDMQVQGNHIPKGTFMTFNNWAIHNDPKYWKNPEEFVPERFLLEGGKKVNTSPESFNAFSYGKRNCPGKLMALMAAMHYFITLMQKFEVLPKDGEKVENGTLFGLTYQATNVELRFIPR